MHGGPLSANPRPDIANEDDASLKDRFRRLIAEFCGGPSVATGSGGDSSQVVCEVVVENERFVLLRCPALDPVEMLSPREREILWLICDGKSNLAISRALAISPWTVSSHLRRVFAKLGVSTRAGAVALLLSSRPGVSNGHGFGRGKAGRSGESDR
jgi:DNA-binding CsgD family transcriptional regulator